MTENYTPEQLKYIDRLAWLIEDQPVRQAVVDYLGTRDADGLVDADAPPERRFGTRDKRHVEIYELRVVRKNAAWRRSGG